MVLFPPPFYFVFDISNLLSYLQNNFSYELARPIMGTIFLVYNTVVPLLRDHPVVHTKVVFEEGWSFIRRRKQCKPKHVSSGIVVLNVRWSGWSLKRGTTVYIYIRDSQLNRPESVSLASLARQLHTSPAHCTFFNDT